MKNWSPFMLIKTALKRVLIRQKTEELVQIPSENKPNQGKDSRCSTSLFCITSGLAQMVSFMLPSVLESALVYFWHIQYITIWYLKEHLTVLWLPNGSCHFTIIEAILVKQSEHGMHISYGLTFYQKHAFGRNFTAVKQSILSCKKTSDT